MEEKYRDDEKESIMMEEFRLENPQRDTWSSKREMDAIRRDWYNDVRA